MDDFDSVMILAIRSVRLSCDPPNLEKIECSMAEAMAATPGVGGYRKRVESWQTAGKRWVAICSAHFRAVCRVCSRVVEAKAKRRVDAESKMLERRSQLAAYSEDQGLSIYLEKALALSPVAQQHRHLWDEPGLSPILKTSFGGYFLVAQWFANDGR